MQVGDLVLFESVMNDFQQNADKDYGIILEFRENVKSRDSLDYSFEALVQFHDEIVWLPRHSLTIMR